MSIEEINIDYNSLLMKRSFSLYNSIQNLKTCLEYNNSNSNSNNDYHNNNDKIKHKQQLQKMEEERNDKLRYTILQDLENICNEINNTNFLPDYTVKLVITPRYKKEDWR